MIKVGIALGDILYAEHLAKGLSHEAGGMEFVLVCKKTMESCVIDALIFDDEERETASAITADDVKRIELTGRAEFDSSRGEDLEIYRYEDASVIVRMISSFVNGRRAVRPFDFSFAGQGEPRLSTGRMPQIAAFKASKGGTGTTSLALTCARILSEEFGKKIIYLSLAPFDGSREYIDISNRGGLLPLIYSVSHGGSMDLAGMLENYNGVTFFRGPVRNQALSTLGREDTEKLITKIAEEADHDILFIDSGDHVTPATECVMDMADVTIHVEDAGRVVPDIDTHQDRDGAALYHADNVRESGNTVFVMNKVQEDSVQSAGKWGNAARGAGAFRGNALMVSYDPASFRRVDGRFWIDMRGKYAADAKDVVVKILEKLNG